MIVFIIILFMLKKKMAIVAALLDSPTIELCPKLCWHNVPNPSGGLASHSWGRGKRVSSDTPWCFMHLQSRYSLTVQTLWLVLRTSPIHVGGLPSNLGGEGVEL